MDSTQAITNLDKAYSTALLKTMASGKTHTIELDFDTSEAISTYIDTLRQRNTELGRRYAAASEAIARVSYLAGELAQGADAAEQNAARLIMERITTNP